MNKVIYQLIVEDVQNVALEELGKELSLEELKDIEELLSQRLN